MLCALETWITIKRKLKEINMSKWLFIIDFIAGLFVVGLCNKTGGGQGRAPA